MVGFFDSLDDVIPAVIAKRPAWAFDAVHVIDTWLGKATVYEGKSTRFGVSPRYSTDEGWKGDEVRGGSSLIEISVDIQTG